MLDFSRQFAALREELMPVIEAVCASQRFILGPPVESFERAAAHALATSGGNAPHAVGCASGTDALWLGFAAARIGSLTPGVAANSSPLPPAAVVTSPFSFFASASAILRAGTRPLFADIDPLTFNLSAHSVRETIARNPAFAVEAVLPIHLYGQCANWDDFLDLERDFPGLLTFEDAAQAFGAAWTFLSGETRAAGTLGAAASFSFYPTKNLAAMGDAGLLTTRSGALAEHARSLRAHGMTRRYFHDEVGWNSRLDSIQAAILEVKLKHLPGWNQRRRALAARYDELFLAAGIAVRTSPERPSTIADGVVLPYVHPQATHVFHQYVVRAPRRDELRAHLTAHGIGSEVYYPLCLHQQEALRHLGYQTGDFPHAERAAAEVLALPMYPELRDDEQQTVVQVIRQFYR